MAFEWLTDSSRKFLEKGYLSEGETPEQRIHAIAVHAERLLDRPGFAEKFYDYMSRGWISLSSPVWANFGKKRGLPVSCFSSYVGDSVGEILQAQSEVGMMSKMGGGTSGYFGDIRPRGSSISDNGKTSGSVHFMELFEKIADVISQGSTRRGRFTPYLPIEHGDINEFLEIGTEGHPIQNLTHGVTVTDAWMKDMIRGDLDKRQTWAKLLQTRSEIGYPYIFFKDNVNRNKPQVYKDHKLDITNSNLCLSPDTLVDVRLNGEEMTVPLIAVDAFFHLGGYESLEVLSCETVTGKKEYKTVTNSAKMASDAETVTVKVGNHHVVSTPDHKFFTVNRGYVEARKLAADDELLLDTGERGHPTVEPGSTTDVYDITVEGHHNFFANGVLVHNCSEILLPVSQEESFVCVLSSVNILHYDDWKDSDLIEVMIYFLDAVVTEFCSKLEAYRDSESLEDKLTFQYMERAYNFAKNHRALGMGVLGYHSYLQRKSYPFNSSEATKVNEEIFRLIKENADAASRKMAEEYGEPEQMLGRGMRHTTLLSCPPTTSSSFLTGQVSQSIEPLMSNYYIKDLAKTKHTVKNVYLELLLEEKGKNTSDVWESIAINDGSVQHLDFLSDHEKEVFLTFKEIDPQDIIDQAAIRQEFLDQTQSLNLMIDKRYSVKEINQLIIDAWKQGICTLYYQHSVNSAQEFARSKLSDCVACEA